MPRIMLVALVTAVMAVSVSGCSSSQPAAETWPGKFFSTTRTVDFYDRTYDITDVKIVCSQAGGSLQVSITAPDGTQVTSTQPQDGSQKADIEVTGGGHESQTLTNGAVWKNVDGEWGFEGDPGDVDSHAMFYLHDGAAICPASH